MNLKINRRYTIRIFGYLKEPAILTLGMNYYYYYGGGGVTGQLGHPPLGQQPSHYQTFAHYSTHANAIKAVNVKLDSSMSTHNLSKPPIIKLTNAGNFEVATTGQLTRHRSSSHHHSRGNAIDNLIPNRHLVVSKKSNLPIYDKEETLLLLTFKIENM